MIYDFMDHLTLWWLKQNDTLRTARQSLQYRIVEILPSVLQIPQFYINMNLNICLNGA